MSQCPTCLSELSPENTCTHCNGQTNTYGEFGINPDAEFITRAGCLYINDKSFLVTHPDTEFVLGIENKVFSFSSENGRTEMPLEEVRGYWA